MSSLSVPDEVWLHDRFQGRYKFMIGSKAGMDSWSIPGPVWVQDRLQDQYCFMIGSRTGIVS